MLLQTLGQLHGAVVVLNVWPNEKVGRLGCAFLPARMEAGSSFVPHCGVYTSILPAPDLLESKRKKWYNYAKDESICTQYMVCTRDIHEIPQVLTFGRDRGLVALARHIVGAQTTNAGV